MEWRAVTGMRDRLIHAYFGVDYMLVWDVVVHKIPDLRRQIAEILDAGRAGPGARLLAFIALNLPAPSVM